MGANMSASPFISVLMSVYNGERFLKEAIESILGQSFVDFEFIIVNDGSNDSSAEIIRSYRDSRIKILVQENKGLSAALNAGLRKAQGKYIARMDADDVSLQHRLKDQYRFLENNSACVALGSNAFLITCEGEYLYSTQFPTQWSDIRKLLPGTFPSVHPTLMMRRDVLLAVGGYYEKIRHYFEDLILINSLAKHGEIFNLDEITLKHRLTPSSITSEKRNISRPFEQSLCAKILAGIDPSEEELGILRRETAKVSNNRKMSEYFLTVGKAYLEKNFNRKKAIENLLLSVAHLPINDRSWFNLVLALLPRQLIVKWKRSRGVEPPLSSLLELR